MFYDVKGFFSQILIYYCLSQVPAYITEKADKCIPSYTTITTGIYSSNNIIKYKYSGMLRKRRNRKQKKEDMVKNALEMYFIFVLSDLIK